MKSIMADRSRYEDRYYKSPRAAPRSFLDKMEQEREELERKRRLRERYPYSDEDNEFLTWDEYCYFHS
jgi:hypothetical protein